MPVSCGTTESNTNTKEGNDVIVLLGAAQILKKKGLIGIVSFYLMHCSKLQELTLLKNNYKVMTPNVFIFQ